MSSGQSHFRDIEVEWVEETRAGKLSKRLPATGIIFREVPPTYDLDWHPAPRRQYIINLDAGVQITASDGESRTIARRRGDPRRGHDRQGHLSRRSKARSAIAFSYPPSNGALNMKLLYFDDYKLGVLKGDRVVDVTPVERTSRIPGRAT